MTQSAPKQPRPKKTYARPKLTTFGDVRNLTQAGTRGGNENSMAMSKTLMTPSERVIKERIVRVGTHPLGFGLYLFDYIPALRDAYGHGRQFGVMADEVAPVVPAAVTMGPAGHFVVDYAALGIHRPVA